MIEPLQLDGVTYTPEIIYTVREALIQIRDNALANDAFEAAVLFSHNIALLDHLAKNTEAV